MSILDAIMGTQTLPQATQMNPTAGGLQQQGNRVVEMIRKATQANQPSLGDELQRDPAQNSQFYQNLAKISMGSAPTQGIYQAGQSAIDDSRTRRADIAKQDLTAETDVYNTMQQLKAQGDAEATKIDQTIESLVGNDPAKKKAMYDELHKDPDELDSTNIATKATNAAARLGLYNDFTSEKDYKFSPEGELIHFGRDGPKKVDLGGGTSTKTYPPEINTPAARKAYDAQLGKNLASDALSAKGYDDVYNKAMSSMKKVGDLVKQPGFTTAVGTKIGSMSYGLGTFDEPLAGTDAADFEARLKEIKGEQFLQAYQSLKGGGAISEIEGQKAEQAISRMSTSQSEEEFLVAAKDYYDVVKKGLETSATKAGKPVPEIPSFEEYVQGDAVSSPIAGGSGVKFLGFEE